MTEKKDSQIFQKAYCINLKQHIQRRQAAQVSASFHDINLTFIEGIWGQDIIKDYPNTTYSAGEMGCMLSHFKAMQQFISDSKEDKDVALILEDDFELHEKFHEILSEVNKVWDREKNGLILLNPWIYDWDKINEVKLIHDVNTKPGIFRTALFTMGPKATGAAGYILTRKYAQQLILEFESKGKEYKFDGIVEAQYTMRDDALIIYDPLVIQATYKSSIQKNNDDACKQYFNIFRARNKYTRQLIKENFKLKPPSGNLNFQILSQTEIKHCYCINLKKDTVRRKLATINSLLHGINIKFIDAIWGADVKKDYPEVRITESELGCALSHLKAMKQFVDDTKEEDEIALILEDDFELHEKFNEIMADVLKVWDRKKNGLLLLSPFFVSWKDVKDLSVIHEIGKKDGVYRMQIFTFGPDVVNAAGYIITRKFAQQKIEEFKNMHRRFMIKVPEDFTTRSPESVLIFDPLVIMAPFKSNIADGREDGAETYFNVFRGRNRYSRQLLSVILQI